MNRRREPLDHQQPAEKQKPTRTPQTPGFNSRFVNRDYAEQREHYHDDDDRR